MTTALVPLFVKDNNGTYLWKNPSMGSTKLCRILEFEYSKETKEKTREKYDFYKNKFDNLEPTYLGKLRLNMSCIAQC